jgi:hypothetical protein
VTQAVKQLPQQHLLVTEDLASFEKAEQTAVNNYV